MLQFQLVARANPGFGAAMLFDPLLRPATLIRRYKRFLADVDLHDGAGPVTAHCANPGAMLGLARPGADIWLSPSPNPKAKLAWRWELEAADDTLVGINTNCANKLVAEAQAGGLIPELAGYENIRSEVPYGENSRIDFLLENEKQKCFVEVKSVTLARQGVAEFPDSVTARGARHLDELARCVAEGHRAVMLYCVQRADCDRFQIAADIDLKYGHAFRAARAAGVEAYAYTCTLSPAEVRVARRIEIVTD